MNNLDAAKDWVARQGGDQNAVVALVTLLDRQGVDHAVEVESRWEARLDAALVEQYELYRVRIQEQTEDIGRLTQALEMEIAKHHPAASAELLKVKVAEAMRAASSQR